MKKSSLDRRTFIRSGALGAATLVLPWGASGSPYDPITQLARRPTNPVRIRGYVKSGRRGISNVAVTDGETVVVTRSNGSFELVSSTARQFVYVSVPAGYQIPQHEIGTAKTFLPIAPNSKGEMRADFTLVELDRSDSDHGFLVMADPQTENQYEMDLFHAETIPDAVDTVKNLGDLPLFGVACGDIMFDDLTLFPEYERGVSKVGIPFFQVVGNHDMDYAGMVDEASTVTFRDRYGPEYYSFDRGSVHYVVLDNVFWNGGGYLGYLDNIQLNWLEQDLALVEAGATVVLFNHIPNLASQYVRRNQGSPSLSVSVSNREALYRLLEPFEAHIVSGHTHEQEHVFEHGTHEHVLGAACGAWWSGPICHDGAPSGYGVFEVRGDELKWRYKGTGHSDDHQIRAYEKGADPAAPDEIIANVWDWDPAWKVFWYENGERKGQMSQRMGKDPLSVELHTGSELPPRRTWVEPMPTNHLFYAPVADGASIRIEAIDRFGRVYTQEL
ncbi:MAG: hypothetical protein HKN13_00855 [Rhodothermales bacterium]|nr:hypothetical protein [Rhodothermales bacterium]